MVIPMRERLRNFNRAAMTTSPIAAYARLHFIIPLSLVAIVALVAVGRQISDTRETAPASALIKSESLKQTYREHLKAFRERLPRDRWVDPGSTTQKRLSPLYAQVAHVAESKGLRCNDRLEYDAADVYCDTRRLDDDRILAIFWGSLGFAAICAMLWLFVQFRESWMLPNWSSHLWYTPAYATALLALGAGPFLMLAVYHSRATGYILSADAWKLGRLGKEFYLLVFLQLTVLCIAAVELRPSAVRFIIGTPILLVIAGLVAALCEVAFLLFHREPAEPWIWLAPVLVGALAALGGLTWWLGRRRRASARARAPFIGRVFQLSQILLIAWLVYAIDASLGLAPTGTWHHLLRALCLALCVLHVIASRWVELRFPERRVSGLRRAVASTSTVPR
jgi:hypothetical protein